LEVAAPKAEKSYFLHVFQVAGEKTRAMSPVRLVAETPEIRIEIGSGDKAWRVAFAANGALTAFVCAPGSKQGVRLKPGVAVKDQYEGQSPK
jgi:hypothetical protein